MRTEKSNKTWIGMLLLFCMLCMCTVSVDAKAATLKVQAGKSTLYVGDSQNCATQLKVTYNKKNVTKSAKYSISDKRTATVNKNGTVKAVKKGSITVTCKYKGKTKRIKITVKNPVLKINSKTAKIQTGKKTTLKIYANKTALKAKDIAWSSSNKKIASVDKNGIVKGLKAGTCTITGKTKTGKVSCKITVLKATCKHTLKTRRIKRVTEPAIKCLACGRWFKDNDQFTLHCFLEPINEYCIWGRNGGIAGSEDKWGEATGYAITVKLGRDETYCTKCGKVIEVNYDQGCEHEFKTEHAGLAMNVLKCNQCGNFFENETTFQAHTANKGCSTYRPHKLILALNRTEYTCRKCGLMKIVYDMSDAEEEEASIYEYDNPPRFYPKNTMEKQRAFLEKRYGRFKTRAFLTVKNIRELQEGNYQIKNYE